MSKIIAANQWRKVISGEEYGVNKPVTLTVTAELIKLGANEYPHFTITGEVSRNDKRYRDPVLECGAIHDTITQHFPELAPLVTVHLSAPDGVPMHAEPNARYWAGLCTYPDGSPMGEYKPLMLASHLRVSLQLAGEIREAMAQGLPWQTITSHANLIQLWSEQAGAARKLLRDNKAVA